MARPKFQRHARRGVAHLLAFVLFALVSFGVAAALLAVRHFALSETEAARRWVETPCVIETNEWTRPRGRKRISLELVYRYEIAGKSYRGDRLDLLAGSMGDDAAWEKRIFERHRPGSRAVCYVDPDNPANSVFDRDNAATKSRNLLLLAFPFLCVGTTFSLVIAIFVTAVVGKPSLDVQTAAQRGWGSPPSPPPRKVSLLQRAAVLAGPLGSQVALPFLVGFTFVFAILDGPNQYRQLIWPETRDGEAQGSVTSVRQLPHRELHHSVYEYEVAYEVDGTRYTTTGATWGQEYDRGDEVTVMFPTDRPEKGVIAGARQSQFAWWHGAIPLAVVVLLALGLTGMYAHNFRVMRLLACGEVAQAKWALPHASGGVAADDDPTKTGYEVPTAETQYQFEVHGVAYAAHSFGPAPRGAVLRSKVDPPGKSPNRKRRRKGAPNQNLDRSSPASQPPATPPTAPVLYNRQRPRRNVLLHGHLDDVVRGQLSRAHMILCCAPAPMAAIAIWWLFTLQ
jgi:hypothetical protein